MKLYILPILLSVLLTTSSCNDQLDDINKNPNATENPEAAYLLTGSLKHGADLYWGNNANFDTELLFIQQWASIQYTESDRYDISNTSDNVTTLWNTSYYTLITDLNTISTMPDTKANKNYKAIALILKSWVFQLLTDSYGDIPYTEAGQVIIPKYDAQKDVYEGLLNDLTEAESSLSSDNGVVEGDVVYNGDVTLWKKFANSLKLRIALRIADREPELAKQTINDLVTNNTTGLIDNISSNFKFIYTSSPQQNPMASQFETREDFRVSKTIVDKLTSLNDPRLPIYAQLPSDTSVHTYVGAANGLSNGDANNQGFYKTSKPGTYFLEDKSPATIFTYSEVLFGLSEAVSREFITGNAEDYYNKAIKASFNQFGITSDTVINNYIKQADVKFDASNYKKSIGDQKWIAFYGQGLDAFAEWRRLDYPILTAGIGSVLNGAMPSRLFYPGTEQSLNGTSYKTAIANQGADLLTTKLWFDMY